MSSCTVSLVAVSVCAQRTRGCVHARNANKAPGAIARPRVANGDPCDSPGGWFASLAIHRAGFARACQHEPHGGNNRLPVLSHADTGARRAGAGAVRVPSSTAHCFAWPRCWLPSPKLLAALRGLPLACQSALAAALATVLLGATAACGHCGALEQHGCGGCGGQ